ncbi:hypothetical protein D1872_320710 [compost metagenome]
MLRRVLKSLMAVSWATSSAACAADMIPPSSTVATGIGSAPCSVCVGPCAPGAASPVAVTSTSLVFGLVVTLIPTPPLIVTASDGSAASILLTLAKAFWLT